MSGQVEGRHGVQGPEPGHGLGAGGDVEGAVGLLQVGLYGAGADAEGPGDAAIGLAVGDELEDVGLAWGQQRARFGIW